MTLTTSSDPKILWDVSLFAIVGAALGFATLLVLHGVDYFAEQPFFEGASATLMGTAVLLAGILGALVASVLLAASIGHTHARGDPSGAARRGLLAGTLGHVTLLVAYVVVLVVGFAVLSSVGGAERELLGEGGATSTRLLGYAFLAAVPSGLAGWGAGRLRATEEDRERADR